MVGGANCHQLDAVLLITILTQARDKGRVLITNKSDWGAEVCNEVVNQYFTHSVGMNFFHGVCYYKVRHFTQKDK